MTLPNLTESWEMEGRRLAPLLDGMYAVVVAATDAALRRAAGAGPFSVYVPVGALWGAQDLARVVNEVVAERKGAATLTRKDGSVIRFDKSAAVIVTCIRGC